MGPNEILKKNTLLNKFENEASMMQCGEAICTRRHTYKHTYMHIRTQTGTHTQTYSHIKYA